MTQAVSSDLAALRLLGHSSLCWQPEYLAPSAALPTLPLLFWLSETLHPQVTVSLGGHQGVAHLALCQAATRLALDTRCLVQLQGPEPGPFRTARQGYSSERSAPVLAGRDGFAGVATAVLTVHLEQRSTQAIGWMPWLQHLPPRGAAVFYGVGAAEVKMLEQIRPAATRLVSLGSPEVPVLLMLGPDMPPQLSELVGDPEARDSFNGFLMAQAACLQQRAGRRPALEPDPTAPQLVVPQTLDEAKAQIVQLIETQVEDFECLAQHLQDREDAAAQNQAQQHAAWAVEQAEVARQKNIVARLDAGMADLYADTEALRQDLDAATAALVALHNSSSWRLTAPLRWLMRGLR